jgi:hypothetical protein
VRDELYKEADMNYTFFKFSIISVRIVVKHISYQFVFPKAVLCSFGMKSGFSLSFSNSSECMWPFVTDSISSSECEAGGIPEPMDKGRITLYKVKHDVIINEITVLSTED